ncbi:hypothetical protein F7734_04940 [Scytonema sp. UIC 10036]|nr:hypothetical protein [Scytonema sp. UIC 10036]
MFIGFCGRRSLIPLRSTRSPSILEKTNYKLNFDLLNQIGLYTFDYIRV